MKTLVHVIYYGFILLIISGLAACELPVIEINTGSATQTPTPTVITQVEFISPGGQSALPTQPGQEETAQVEAAAQASAIAPLPTETLVPTQPIDFASMMKNASILLYEDMVNNTNTNRYVKDTLNRMGLNYKDDGSAKGWLKTDLTAGGPNGQPWDLVIIAAEAKSGVQGEFFEYVLQALNQGSSVIMEVWYLDQTYTGTASAILSQCGVQFSKDWANVPPSRMVMFPLDTSHPILYEPNSNLAFTDVTSYWADIYDIGDWLQLTPGSQARLLVGTMPTDKTGHGTVVVCFNERLILQTFSSHQLTFNEMTPVWENYIYHALKVRLLGAP